ncbi:MAG TPA: diacylglycerol kinase family protein [Ramlibacter sp.]
MPAPELFIVMNQGSGHNEKDEVREAIEAELKSADRRYRFIPVAPGEIVQACQHAARLAKESGGVVVGVGGDGTISCAAQAALAHDCPLGVIAQGTFNLFARTHGLPLEATAAARALLHASPQDVQVGLVNQRPFLVNASVGLYPKLLADREVVKQKLGRRRWIAMLAGLKTLAEWRLQLRLDVDLDGTITQLRTPSLFICNNRLQLDRLGIEAQVLDQLGQGRLVGLYVPVLKFFTKLRLVVRALLGTLGDTQELQSFTLRTINVGTRNARQLKVATDGEVQFMQLPLRFAVSPRPLKLMLPPVEERMPIA